MSVVFSWLFSWCLHSASVDSCVVHFSRICVQYDRVTFSLDNSKMRVVYFLASLPVRENYLLFRIQLSLHRRSGPLSYNCRITVSLTFYFLPLPNCSHCILWAVDYIRPS